MAEEAVKYVEGLKLAEEEAAAKSPRLTVKAKRRLVKYDDQNLFK